MNPVPGVRRSAGNLAWLASVLLALITVAPAALATPRPWPPGWNKHPPLPASTQPAVRFPPGWNKHPPLPVRVHALVTSGMPGWQITLITVAAVLLVAALAVIIGRARAARRRTTANAA